MANLSELDDGVRLLTLHRPDKLDALDHALVDALGDAGAACAR